MLTVQRPNFGLVVKEMAIDTANDMKEWIRVPLCSWHNASIENINILNDVILNPIMYLTVLQFPA